MVVREEFIWRWLMGLAVLLEASSPSPLGSLYDATAKVLTERPKSYPSGVSLSLATNNFTS